MLDFRLRSGADTERVALDVYAFEHAPWTGSFWGAYDALTGVIAFPASFHDVMIFSETGEISALLKKVSDDGVEFLQADDSW